MINYPKKEFLYVLVIMGCFLVLGLLWPYGQSSKVTKGGDMNEFRITGSINDTNSETKHTARDYEKEFFCEYVSNVAWTECEIEQLDRAAAIREWKQRKLEAIKHPEINVNDLSSELAKETQNIKVWRENFENSRDSECVARFAFRAGSGRPGGIAECGLAYEIAALYSLDYIYYNTVLEHVSSSQGVSEFEPSQEDIGKLADSNKTTRGCAWADDPACEY